MPTKRVICLVLDSLGIGASADADAFGDAGSDTLGHIASHFLQHGQALELPNMASLGLLHAYHTSTGRFPAGMKPPETLTGRYASAEEISSGKDTPSGHWERAGAPALWDWGYFPDHENSFPPELLDEIVTRSNISGYLGNCHASGTEIIARLGEEHMRSGKPIFYTSADSVFQIACHEQSFGLEKLYQLCELCREILEPWNIGRVIARPFVGSSADTFERTGDRHDYALEPPQPTVLQKLVDQGGTVQEHLQLALYVMAGATLVYGNLAALAQQNFKRLLAYSSIAHAGFLLMGVGSANFSSVSFYLGTYLLMTFTAFFILALVRNQEDSDSIEAFDGLGKRNPILALCLTITMAALAGIPLTAGFIGKFLVFEAAISASASWWLIAVAFISVAAGFYYYLKVVKAMYWHAPRVDKPLEIPVITKSALAVLTLAILVFGIWPQPIMDLLKP